MRTGALQNDRDTILPAHTDTANEAVARREGKACLHPIAAFETAANADIAALEAVAITATGAAPRYACRAWVNFNGTGTVAIRESGNVSSITDNGTGDYTINFTTAMPDAKYAVFVSSGDGATAPVAAIADNATARTTTAVRVRTANTSFSMTDSSTVSVAVFR